MIFLARNNLRILKLLRRLKVLFKIFLYLSNILKSVNLSFGIRIMLYIGIIYY